MRKMLNQKESNYNRLRRAKMDKSMFVKIKTLGIGAFGEVCLTRKVDTGALYAMKTLRKKDVLNRNQVIITYRHYWFEENLNQSLWVCTEYHFCAIFGIIAFIDIDDDVLL